MRRYKKFARCSCGECQERCDVTQDMREPYTRNDDKNFIKAIIKEELNDEGI